MPRQIVVSAWCDPCYAVDQHTEGHPVVVRIGHLKRDKPRELLLCDTHRKEYLGPLEHLLEDAPVFDPDNNPAAAAPAAAGVMSAAAPATSGPSKGRSTVPANGAPPGHMAVPLERGPEDLPQPTVGPDGESVFTCTECPPESAPVYTTKERRRPAQSFRLHLRQQHGQDV